MFFLAMQCIHRQQGSFQIQFSNEFPDDVGFPLLAIVKGLLVYHQAALVGIHLHQGHKVLVALRVVTQSRFKAFAI